MCKEEGTNMQGSLINRLVERVECKAPEIGDGATEYCYTDRECYTVVEVSKSGKSVTLQADSVKAAENVDFGHQSWVIEPNPNGRKVVVTFRKDGKWKVKGTNFRIVRFGSRDYYYDWSF